MKILFFGDVFGRPGREALKKILPDFVEKYKPDFTIANVENIAHGSGVTEKTLSELEELGIFNAYTSGDHIWDSKNTEELLKNSSISLIRPANFYDDSAGRGFVVVSVGARRLLIINLLGQVFIKYDVSNPFVIVDNILEKYTMHSNEDDKEYVDAIFVDFHAEATSEKRAMGFHLDGRVSAVVGTHTHVPTNDAQILKGGTGYLTDSGMVGSHNSVIGLDKNSIVTEYISNTKQRKEVAEENFAEIGAVLIELKKNGFAKKIEPLRQIVEI